MKKILLLFISIFLFFSQKIENTHAVDIYTIGTQPYYNSSGVQGGYIFASGSQDEDIKTITPNYIYSGKYGYNIYNKDGSYYGGYTPGLSSGLGNPSWGRIFSFNHTFYDKTILLFSYFSSSPYLGQYNRVIWVSLTSESGATLISDYNCSVNGTTMRAAMVNDTLKTTCGAYNFASGTLSTAYDSSTQLELLDYRESYSLDYNQMRWLDTTLKIFNRKIWSDTSSSYITLYDVVPTWSDMKGFTYFTDYTDSTSAFSIYGDNGLMRAYNPYDGDADELGGDYEEGVFNQKLAQTPNTYLWLTDPAFDGNHFTPGDNQLQAFVYYDFSTYWLRWVTSTGVILTSPLGVPSGWDGGYTGGGVSGISYDTSIWDWDFDDDGEVGLLNGEVFRGIGEVIQYIINKILTFFNSLLSLLEQLGGFFTSDVNTFSFIPTASAADINQLYSIDNTSFDATILGQFYNFFKGFFIFLIFSFGIFAFLKFNKND